MAYYAHTKNWNTTSTRQAPSIKTVKLAGAEAQKPLTKNIKALYPSYQSQITLDVSQMEESINTPFWNRAKFWSKATTNT